MNNFETCGRNYVCESCMKRSDSILVTENLPQLFSDRRLLSVGRYIQDEDIISNFSYLVQY